MRCAIEKSVECGSQFLREWYPTSDCRLQALLQQTPANILLLFPACDDDTKKSLFKGASPELRTKLVKELPLSTVQWVFRQLDPNAKFAVLGACEVERGVQIMGVTNREEVRTEFGFILAGMAREDIPSVIETMLKINAALPELGAQNRDGSLLHERRPGTQEVRVEVNEAPRAVSEHVTVAQEEGRQATPGPSRPPVYTQPNVPSPASTALTTLTSFASKLRSSESEHSPSTRGQASLQKQPPSDPNIVPTPDVLHNGDGVRARRLKTSHEVNSTASLPRSNNTLLRKSSSRRVQVTALGSPAVPGLAQIDACVFKDPRAIHPIPLPWMIEARQKAAGGEAMHQELQAREQQVYDESAMVVKLAIGDETSKSLFDWEVRRYFALCLPKWPANGNATKSWLKTRLDEAMQRFPDLLMTHPYRSHYLDSLETWTPRDVRQNSRFYRDDQPC